MHPLAPLWAAPLVPLEAELLRKVNRQGCHPTLGLGHMHPPLLQHPFSNRAGLQVEWKLNSHGWAQTLTMGRVPFPLSPQSHHRCMDHCLPQLIAGWALAPGSPPCHWLGWVLRWHLLFMPLPAIHWRPGGLPS